MLRGGKYNRANSCVLVSREAAVLSACEHARMQSRWGKGKEICMGTRDRFSCLCGMRGMFCVHRVNFS